jgi:hypothetical protein
MHRGLLVVIMIFGFLGCSRPNNFGEDIEYMSYHWSSYKHVPWHINYHIYAIIDKTGQGTISIH